MRAFIANARVLGMVCRWLLSDLLGPMTLSICIAQLNFTVGDLRGNAQKIIDAAHAAHAGGAALLLTPELALCGYAAEDLFLRPAFRAACDDAVKRIAEATAALKDLVIVLGHPQRASGAAAFATCFNAASVLRAGCIEQTYAKRELPNYEVFDERRYFRPGEVPCVFEVAGLRVGLLICEDAWHTAAARDVAAAGAQLIAVINASPFHSGKSSTREETMRARVQETGLPLIIHARAADEDMETILAEGMATAPYGCVMHCFSSGRRLAEAALEMGFYLSMSGIAAFPKSHDLREIFARAPLERILLETDSPYLAPPPHRRCAALAGRRPGARPLAGTGAPRRPARPGAVLARSRSRHPPRPPDPRACSPRPAYLP